MQVVISMKFLTVWNEENNMDMAAPANFLKASQASSLSSTAMPRWMSSLARHVLRSSWCHYECASAPSSLSAARQNMTDKLKGCTSPSHSFSSSLSFFFNCQCYKGAILKLIPLSSLFPSSPPLPPPPSRDHQELLEQRADKERRAARYANTPNQFSRTNTQEQPEGARPQE